MERERKGLFIGATHGNEEFSLDVLRRLEDKYPKNKWGYDWIVGNPRALESGTRYVEVDLNRSAPGDSESSLYEERRAAEIVELSQRYSFVIDLHGSDSDCGIVTIIPYPTLPNILLAATLPIQRNVIWYSQDSLQKGPLVQFTDCPGVEIECGPKSSDHIKTELEVVISKFLEQGANWDVGRALDSLRGKEFYYIYGVQPDDGHVYNDFTLAQNKDEEFYPFLSHQYPGIACCKMKRINFKELFLI